MSSTPTHTTSSHFNTDAEHLTNFESLPFHFFPTSPDIEIPFTLSSIHLAYHQIPTEAFDHTYIESTLTHSTNSSSSHTSSSTTSSLPPLVPNSDISHTLHHDLIEGFSTLNLSEPPHYTSSTEDPPEYEYPRNNTLILRRIRIIERESISTVLRLRRLREAAIRQLSADIERQIEDQIARDRETIAYLASLLNL